jgi:replication-associated recombination protein RarA
MTNLALEFPQSLADKYRPRRLQDFIGVSVPRRVMQSFIRRPYSSTWFLLGPSGMGKTSMAQAVGLEIGAEVHHIPSQSCDLAAIDHVCQMCHYVPANGQFHLVVVDEADRMTNGAQLALLSKLDSTAFPPQTIFFFTANTSLPLEPRFLSRCRILVFEAESLETELAHYLRRVYNLECGLTLPLSYFTAIAKDSENNVRDALGKLEIEIMLDHPRKGRNAKAKNARGSKKIFPKVREQGRQGASR